MATTQIEEEKFQWFFIDPKIEDKKEKVKGPVTARYILFIYTRDLDVLYRTGPINAKTFVFREGMKEWQ